MVNYLRLSLPMARYCSLLLMPVLLVVGQSEDPTPACGSKFTDPSSSALLADLVLQGTVEELRQASPLAPLLYRATVRVHKVHKGQELLLEGLEPSSPGTRKPQKQVEVERFGPEENKENCVARVLTGQTYLFFLKVRNSLETGQRTPGDSSPLLTVSSLRSSASTQDHGPLPLANTALPLGMDPETVRQVRKVLCPGCAFAPVIKRLKCEHCATAPVLKRKMSSNETKVVKEGKRLSLRCVSRGNPGPSYIWMKDGRVLPSSREETLSTPGSPNILSSDTLSIITSKQHSLLVIRKLTSDDAGEYRCLATNAMGEVTQSVHVIVKEQRTPAKEQMAQSSRSQPQDETPGPCAINPCYHGGSCYPDENNPERPRCDCMPNFHGGNCQFKRRPVTDEEYLAPVPNVQPDASDNLDNNIEDTPGESSSSLNHTDNSLTLQTPSNSINQPVTISNQIQGLDTSFTPQSNGSSTAFGRKADLTEKQRRKLATASRLRYGGLTSDDQSAKSRAPQLKVSDCSDEGLCLNGGSCRLVAEIGQKFCVCAGGFAGRRCEIRI